MGKEIFDPYHIESDIEKTEGFGIMDTVTTMEKTKYTKQVEKTLSESDCELLCGCNGLHIKGYEIHQGITHGSEKNLTVETDYTVLAKDNAFGTYIHGIFDNSKFTRTFLNNIRKKKGLNPLNELFEFSEFKENEYNKLADLLRNNLDIDAIYGILK